jgi:hypothetical protein
MKQLNLKNDHNVVQTKIKKEICDYPVRRGKKLFTISLIDAGA